MTASAPELKRCPRCKKPDGHVNVKRDRVFPYQVVCGTCGASTEPAKLASIAITNWNSGKVRD